MTVKQVALSEDLTLILTEILEVRFGGDVEEGFRAMVSAYIMTHLVPKEEFDAMMTTYGEAITQELLLLKNDALAKNDLAEAGGVIH